MFIMYNLIAAAEMATSAFKSEDLRGLHLFGIVLKLSFYYKMKCLEKADIWYEMISLI